MRERSLIPVKIVYNPAYAYKFQLKPILADMGKKLDGVNDTCEGLLLELQEMKISRNTVENSCAGASKL